jgi:TolB-like protein
VPEVFISYGHSTAARQARGAAAALRALGYSVWLDEDLPAHRAFTPEIEAQLSAAKAALIIWSAEGAKSHWVLSEANRAREANKLVQLSIDGARLPMPFDQIQCADLSGWSGEGEHPGWGKVAASVRELVGPTARDKPVTSGPRIGARAVGRSPTQVSAERASSPIDLAHEERFDLAGLEVRPSTREIVAGEQRTVLEPRVMQVLVAFARRLGEVVSRDDLVGAAWGGRAVSEDAINRAVGIVRRVAETYGGFSIATVAKVGYRLTSAAPFEETPPSDEAPMLPSTPSIAVLPFANLSGDPEQDYFADGMVEEIALQLSRITSISVIGARSTLTFKGKDLRLQEIGRQLGVRYLLEGSVRKGGERVRIAVNLVEAADGAQLWAERFEGALADIFALQDDVASAVANRIKPSVETAELRRTSRRPVESLGSYDLYLKAGPLRHSHDREAMRQSMDLLERSLALDPRFAPALAQLAMFHCYLVIYYWVDGDEVTTHLSRARELAQRALRAAPDDPRVLGIAGEALTVVKPDDLTVGAPFIERAVALNPGSGRARLSHAVLQLLRGAPEGAIEDVEAFVRLDPLSEEVLDGTARLFLGVARFQQGRFAEAVDLLEGVVGLPAISPAAPDLLAAAYGQLGDIENASKALAKLRERTPNAARFFPKILGNNPKHVRMHEDGIAVAEGRVPSRPE